MKTVTSKVCGMLLASALVAGSGLSANIVFFDTLGLSGSTADPWFDGELDENVHPAATLQLVDALIEADKNFDMLIMPNMHHGLAHHPYFVRNRWDYFVKHLHDVVPPSYSIESL